MSTQSCCLCLETKHPLIHTANGPVFCANPHGCNVRSERLRKAQLRQSGEWVIDDEVECPEPTPVIELAPWLVAA